MGKFKEKYKLTKTSMLGAMNKRSRIKQTIGVREPPVNINALEESELDELQKQLVDWREQISTTTISIPEPPYEIRAEPRADGNIEVAWRLPLRYGVGSVAERLSAFYPPVLNDLAERYRSGEPMTSLMAERPLGLSYTQFAERIIAATREAAQHPINPEAISTADTGDYDYFVDMMTADLSRKLYGYKKDPPEPVPDLSGISF